MDYEYKGEYAGSDWIQRTFGYRNAYFKISELGIQVGDLLGELYRGIYHLNTSALSRVEWGNDYVIMVSVPRGMATFDFDELTRLVLLAHRMAIRVEISPAGPRNLRLMFHRRQRNGSIYEKHPTIEQAIERFNAHVGVPFFEDRIVEPAAQIGAVLDGNLPTESE